MIFFRTRKQTWKRAVPVGVGWGEWGVGGWRQWGGGGRGARQSVSLWMKFNRLGCKRNIKIQLHLTRFGMGEQINASRHFNSFGLR